MRTTSRTASAGLASALVLALALGAGAVQARVLNVRDEGYLRFLTSSGSTVIDAGHVHGTLPGAGRVRFVYNGNPTITASFTISGNGWTLHGKASCRLNNPNSNAPSFRGSLTLTGGGGRYARAHGSGELFGVFYRRSYALSVQAIGRVHY
jgi:hypothetical protein